MSGASSQPAGLAGVGGAAQLGVQRGVGLAMPMREREQQPRRRAAHDRGDERDRGRVGPVQVVEHQREPARGGQRLEQRAHGAVQLVALHGRPGVAGQRREGPAEGREMRAAGGPPAAAPPAAAARSAAANPAGGPCWARWASSASISSAYGTSRSYSEQRALSTSAPAVRAEAPRWSSNVVLPIPASPTISTTERRLVATASSSTATSPDRPTSGGPLAAESGLVTVQEGSYVPPAHYFFARTLVVKRAAGPARPDLVEPVMVTVSLVPFAGSLIDVVERLTVRVRFSPVELRMSTCWL